MFCAPQAPWQNGTAESLIKSVKKAIVSAIGLQVLTFSELQMVILEAANFVNERPIGIHPNSPEDGTYLCPNELLLGRATPWAPRGPFRECSTLKQRFSFVQSIIDAFWRKWMRDYFPSLYPGKDGDVRNVDVKYKLNNNSHDFTMFDEPSND